MIYLVDSSLLQRHFIHNFPMFEIGLSHQYIDCLLIIGNYVNIRVLRGLKRFLHYKLSMLYIFT